MVGGVARKNCEGESGVVQEPQPHELPFALRVGPTLNHFRQSPSEGRNMGHIPVLELCYAKLELNFVKL